MLTDDDLTRRLGEVFRGAITDLTYTGRTRPPRPMTAAVPAVAVAGAVAAVAVGVGLGSGSDAPAKNGPSIAIKTSSIPAPKHKMVTKKMHLAGFTVTYRLDRGVDNPVIAEHLTALPDGVKPVSLDNPDAKGWTGTDAASGDTALYVRLSTDDGGRLFALLSPTWSDQQLIDLFNDPNPATMPEVPAGSTGH